MASRSGARMPSLDNPRHEKVAVGIAIEGLTQVGAYENAGYEPNDSHACRLVGKGRMSERIGQLQAEYAVQATENVEQHLARLTAMSEKAIAPALADPKGGAGGVHAVNNTMKYHDAPMIRAQQANYNNGLQITSRIIPGKRA